MGVKKVPGMKNLTITIPQRTDDELAKAKKSMPEGGVAGKGALAAHAVQFMEPFLVPVHRYVYSGQAQDLESRIRFMKALIAEVEGKASGRKEAVSRS